MKPQLGILMQKKCPRLRSPPGATFEHRSCKPLLVQPGLLIRGLMP